MRRLLSLMLSVAMVVLSVGACDAGKKSSGIEGKVLDGSGKSLSGIKVVATQKEPLKGYDKIETKTRNDGGYELKGLYPNSQYTISLDGGACENALVIRSAPEDETKIIQEIRIAYSPLRKGADGVLVDIRTGLEWLPAQKVAVKWDEANQYVKNLTHAGGGWRLPSRAELRDIFFPSVVNNKCNVREQLLTWEGSCAWSSELSGQSDAWRFNFEIGQEDTRLRDYSDTTFYRALAVRSKK